MNATLLLSLALLGLAGGAPHDDDLDSALQKQQIQWKGRPYTHATLPETLGQGPPAAVLAWAPWTLGHGYRMDLVDDGRLLLISPEKNGKLGRQLELIKQTQKLFDELVPAPPREEVVADEPDAAPTEPGAELPEDPDGGPVGWLPQDEAPLPFTYSYEWGAGAWPVDTETCVLFVVHDEKDYGFLVDALAEMQEYLRPWAATAKQHVGFVHERPLAAAYIENASGQEEWDPDNEVVHRTAQMLFVRRFSSLQPHWIAQGFSWFVENRIRKAIYCFPDRDEFVWATEHTGWDNELANLFKDRKDEPLKPAEFADWKRGKYEARSARIAFGLVGFIVHYHPEAFSAFLEDQRLFSLGDNRKDLGGGTWERDEDYVLSSEDQVRFLTRHFGPSFLADATGYFRFGTRYKLKK
jgi:hypothetical protein